MYFTFLNFVSTSSAFFYHRWERVFRFCQRGEPNLKIECSEKILKISNSRKFIKFFWPTIREGYSPRNTILTLDVRESLYLRKFVLTKLSTNIVVIELLFIKIGAHVEKKIGMYIQPDLQKLICFSIEKPPNSPQNILTNENNDNLRDTIHTHFVTLIGKWTIPPSLLIGPCQTREKTFMILFYPLCHAYRPDALTRPQQSFCW